MAKSKKKIKACVYCGSSMSPTIDHIIPKSKWHVYSIKRRILDNKSNKVIACFKCNQEKDSMSPKMWFDLHPEFKEHFIRETKYLSNKVKEISGLT